MAELSGRSRGPPPVWSPIRPGRWAVMDESERLGAALVCGACARHPRRPARRAKVCGSCMPARMDRKPSNTPAGARSRPRGPHLVGRNATLPGSRTVSGGVASRGRRGLGQATGDPVSVDLVGCRPARLVEPRPLGWYGRWRWVSAKRPARSRPSRPTVSYPRGRNLATILQHRSSVNTLVRPATAGSAGRVGEQRRCDLGQHVRIPQPCSPERLL
jgi:hypothetical protein